MNEEDFIREAFKKVNLNYPIDNLEDSVLQKLEIKRASQKKKRKYFRLGIIGFALFLGLSILFILNLIQVELPLLTVNFYSWIGIPFLLILFLVHMNFINDNRITKRSKL